LRHAATYALLSRRDVIIVASVSCIYGIGAREAYGQMTCAVSVGQEVGAATGLLRRLVELAYQRNDVDFHRGTFRVKGDTRRGLPGLRGRHRDQDRVLRRTPSRRWPRSTRCGPGSSGGWTR